MREFKFRAWDKRSKKFVQSGIQFNNTTMTLEAIPDIILTQSTGLKDTDGKEIYEGDIVEYNYYYDLHHPTISRKKVVWIDKDASFGCQKEWESSEKCTCGQTHTHKYPGISTFRDILSGSKKDSLKVLGNIYENPELLEDQS